MSANLELVRSIHAAWERGDFSSADWAHPAIEFLIVGGSAAGSWTGVAEMARVWRDYLSAWEGYRAEPAEEYRELDEERVLVLEKGFLGRGKTSGLALRQIGRTSGANLFHIRGGKVARLVVYAGGRELALADLRLAGEGSASGA